VPVRPRRSGFQRIPHVRETGVQAADIVDAGGADVDVEVAFTHLLGFPGEPVDRARRAVAEDRTDTADEDDTGAGGDQSPLLDVLDETEDGGVRRVDEHDPVSSVDRGVAHRILCRR